MQSIASNVEDYLEALAPERQAVLRKLHASIMANLPEGFQARMSYGMIGYVVPHDVYPNGYHCNPQEPLPFAGLASQKNAISFYHMGLYADTSLLDWFQQAYAANSKFKLDMGKSCIRFKSEERIPFSLIEELISRISAHDWIELYERNIKPKPKTK